MHACRQNSIETEEMICIVQDVCDLIIMSVTSTYMYAYIYREERESAAQ